MRDYDYDEEAYCDYLDAKDAAEAEARAAAEEEYHRTNAPEEPAWMTEPDYNEEN